MIDSLTRYRPFVGTGDQSRDNPGSVWLTLKPV